LKEITGVLHIHSTYSFDGKISLEELVEICRKHGHSFAVLTEHAERMTNRDMKRLVLECDERSVDNFVLIPGLEIICDGNLHILALGVEEYLYNTEPESLIEEVHELGGLAVLAHPSKKTPSTRVAGLELDALEIWNARHDGRLAPRMGSIKLCRIIGDGRLPGCCGLDLHEKEKFIDLHVKMKVNDINANNILNNIKFGRFKISNSIISVDPYEDPGIIDRSFYSTINGFNFSIKMAKILFRKIQKSLLNV